jgi:hypothetical protein
MALFLDIEALSARQTDMALGAIYKALNGHDGDDIWLPHDNPFIARLVALFTDRGLMRLDAFHAGLLAWSAGQRAQPGDRIARPAGLMERWTPGELDLVKLYLEHLPPTAWTLADHMMMVDYLTQRYLPADDMRTEASWLATRSNMMGRVQANMETITAEQEDKIVPALPSTSAEAVSRFVMRPDQRLVLEFAEERAAENVRDFTSTVRHRMRGVISRHLEQQQLTGGVGYSLETKLLDEFGRFNRDWRRIAVTEAGEAQLQGYVASVTSGTKLKRMEQYKNACAFCRGVDGRVMEVVDPGLSDKNGETQIWVGKTNIGRSAAPRKREGVTLIDREPDEMWWLAAGVQHPHCRGRWVPTIEERPGDDPDFAAYLRDVLAGKPHADAVPTD